MTVTGIPSCLQLGSPGNRTPPFCRSAATDMPRLRFGSYVTFRPHAVDPVDIHRLAGQFVFPCEPRNIVWHSRCTGIVQVNNSSKNKVEE